MTSAASTITIVYPDGRRVQANSAQELMDELAAGEWVWRLKGPDSDPRCLVDSAEYQRAYRASSYGSGELVIEPSKRPTGASYQSLAGIERALERSQEAREAFDQAQQQSDTQLIGGAGGSFQPDLGSKPGVAIVKLNVVHGEFRNVPDTIYQVQVTRHQIAGSDAATETTIGGRFTEPTREGIDFLPPAEFTLDQDDFLSSVEVGTRAWIRNQGVSNVVARLRFTTSKGHVFEVGDTEAPSGGVLSAPPGFMITGFPCRAGGIIDGFGISCQPLS
jgi:hypothetical protein